MCLRYINDVTYKFSTENRGNQVPNIYEYIILHALICIYSRESFFREFSKYIPYTIEFNKHIYMHAKHPYRHTKAFNIQKSFNIS